MAFCDPQLFAAERFSWGAAVLDTSIPTKNEFCAREDMLIATHKVSPVETVA